MTGTIDDIAFSGSDDVRINGNNAQWPTSLNSPQFPQGGAGGEGGGGKGGDASMVTNAETLRGQDGDSPFVLAGSGGGGGGGARRRFRRAAPAL